MIYGIVPGSETYSEEGKGGVYTVTYRCDREDILPETPYSNPWMPHYGDEMPGYPLFRCVDVRGKEGKGGDWEVTCTYSTERQLAESFCDESLEFSVEPCEDNTGYVWEDAGTPVTEPLPKYRPILVITLKLREALSPLNKIFSESVLNCVNEKKFRGISPGYLKFEGASADNSYAMDGTLISAASVYKFTARTKPWNQEWRKALQARDADGNLLVWQNIDDAHPFFTDDQAKIATPVWVNQVPESDPDTTNIAGTADWDTPTKETLPYYPSCDFATELNLPRKAGDG